MDHIDFTYTHGMEDSAVAERLAETETGVLALSNTDDAYAVPLAHYYDGDGLYFRLGSTEGSRKHAFIESTETAAYLLYDTEVSDAPRELDSWSIVITGPLHTLSEERHAEFDTAEINRRFSPIRVFDENIDDIEINIIELEIETITGRTTSSA